jgi:hydrogenase nickel incorporation protein HypA/HybF
MAVHELAVAAELVDLARRVAAEERASRVTVLRLRIGAANCLSPDSLAFGFEALAAGTEAEGCRLEVERPAAPVTCSACGYQGRIAELGTLACPDCGLAPLTIRGGRELTVTSLDVE